MWLISGRRHAAELAAARDDTDRLCGERDASRENAVAWHAAAVRTAEQLIDTAFVNNCLTEDLTAAAARIAEYGIRRTVPEVLEEHDVHRKALADALGEQKYHLNWGQLIAEVGQLNGAAEAWMADHTAEKQRADHLQQRLDQVLGLDDAAVALGASWQARRQKHMQFDKPTVEETGS